MILIIWHYLTLFCAHRNKCKNLSIQTKHVNFRYMKSPIFFGNLKILIFIKQPFQIACICLTLELQNIFWSLLAHSYNKKLAIELLGKWISGFARFLDIRV